MLKNQVNRNVKSETDESNIPHDYYENNRNATNLPSTSARQVVEKQRVTPVNSNMNNVRFGDEAAFTRDQLQNIYYDEEGYPCYYANNNTNNTRRPANVPLNTTFDVNQNEVDIDLVRDDVRRQFQIPDDQGIPEAIADYVRDGLPARQRPAAHSTMLPIHRQQVTNSFGFTPQDIVLGQTTPQSLRPPSNAMANTRLRVHPNTGRLTTSRGTNVLEQPINSLHPSSKGTSGLRELEGPKVPEKGDNFDKMVPKLKGQALSNWATHIERLLAAAGYYPPYHPELKYKIYPLILNRVGSTYANLVPDDTLEVILETLYNMDSKLQSVDDLFREKQAIPFTPSATFQTLVQKISRLIEPNVEMTRQTQAPRLLAWQIMLKNLPAKLAESECVMEIEHLPTPEQWVRMDKLYKKLTKAQRGLKGEINSISMQPDFGDDDDSSTKNLVKELVSALKGKISPNTTTTSKTTNSSSTGALTVTDFAGSNNNALQELLPIVQTADGKSYAVHVVNKSNWNGQQTEKPDAQPATNGNNRKARRQHLQGNNKSANRRQSSDWWSAV